MSKNILAENMIRFGVKNLNESNKHKIEFLIEQAIEGGKEQPYLTTSTDPKVTKNINKSWINSVATMGGNTANIENELKSAFPGIYDQFIASLTTADVKTTAKIWYLKLDQNTRKGMLEQFKQFLGSSKSEKVSIKISKGKVSSETIAIEKAKTDNIPYPVSIDQAGVDVFVDNQSVLTVKIQQSIDASIQKIIQEKQNIPNIKLKLNNLTIASSSSRFRNTNEAKDMTWEQLSRARSQNVLKYILSQLKSAGVDISNYNYTEGGGYNGDGTSGPNPGMTEDGKPYAISIDGTFNNVDNTGKSRNDFGKPHATKAEYDIYKFILISADISGIVEDPNITKPAGKTFTDYSILFTPVSDRIIKLKHSKEQRNPRELEIAKKVANKALECSFTGTGLAKKLVQVQK